MKLIITGHNTISKLMWTRIDLNVYLLSADQTWISLNNNKIILLTSWRNKNAHKYICEHSDAEDLSWKRGMSNFQNAGTSRGQEKSSLIQNEKSLQIEVFLRFQKMDRKIRRFLFWIFRRPFSIFLTFFVHF